MFIYLQGTDVLEKVGGLHNFMNWKRVWLIEEAMYRSIRWLDRCIKAHKKPTEQNLFRIIQGGLDPKLRKIQCCTGSQMFQ